MIDKSQILAALKKLGPSSLTAIANEMNAEPATISYHMRNMLKAGAVKAAGTTSNRVYALPEQKLEGAKDAPRKARKPGPKKGARKGSKRGRAKKHRVARTAPAKVFLPAFTAEGGMVIVRDDGHEIFNPEQTQEIANLLLDHFEA